MRCFVFLSILVAGCGGGPAPRVLDPQQQALERTTIATLDIEACPRLLSRTFPLESGGATSGKLWVRRCTTHESAGALDVDLDVLGWQWIGEGSFGFDVREYVYFRASVKSRLRAAVEVDADRPKLRVWSDTPPEVTVRDLGRVSARASSPAASMLGVASGIFGQGPNVLATSALRSRVSDMIRERATKGIVVALGNAPPPGRRASDAPSLLLDETEMLHPGGALLSGEYPAGVATTMRWDVAGKGAALARAVCASEALGLVDAVALGSAKPTSEGVRERNDLVVASGAGEARIPPMPCAWVLVTGAQADDAVTAHFALAPAAFAAKIGTKRWVRATIRAYALDGAEKERLFAVSVGKDGAMRTLGRPLTTARADSVWLVAEPVEIADGESLAIGLAALVPRAKPWWDTGVAYDEKPLARATIAPEKGALHEEKRARLAVDGRDVGFVDVALDELEVP
ncbi:MAG TPA: hypothetical protein VIF62_34990 [Labilithrix sp.]